MRKNEIEAKAREAGLESPRMIPRLARGNAVKTVINFGPSTARRSIVVDMRPDEVTPNALAAAFSSARTG